MKGKNKMKKNREGKPTKFQIETIKALGGDVKNIRKYRDAENAIRRLRCAKMAKAVKKAQDKATKEFFEPAKEKYRAKNGAAQNNKPTTTKVGGDKKTDVGKKPVKRVVGIGKFSVCLGKSDVIEALLVGFAKSLLTVFDHR